MKASKAEKYFVYFPLWKPHSWGKRSAAQPQTVYSEFPPRGAAKTVIAQRGNPDVLLKGVPNVIQPNQSDQ